MCEGECMYVGMCVCVCVCEDACVCFFMCVVHDELMIMNTCVNE